jgi:toxin ParE1/3/4
MSVVFRTRQADADLTEIALQIAKQNPQAADRWLDLIDAKCQTLSRMPEMGRKRFDLSSGLRSLAVNNYVIFYRPLSDGIQVVRVLHGARDIPALFD